MTQQAGAQPVFDPLKLERLKVESEYPMEPDDFKELYHNARYCDMAHINSKGYPIVTPMFFVVLDERIHLSSIKGYRYKVHALEKRPNMSCAIHNDGMQLRHQKSILVVGKAEVSDDRDLRTRVHWGIVDKYWPELAGEQRDAAFAAVDTPLRAIIRLVPERIISWDFGKMVQAYDPGVWFNEAFTFPTRGGAADKRK